jgi:Mg-chelatase subunit ChlD
MDGTSMAAPHVSGVAGLVFAANPNLTGAEVKKILLASTNGRFYYTGGYSGMIDAEAAVIYALQTRNQSVNRVINTGMNDGLDLCFVVDTTGSMGPYIDDAKANMRSILSVLEDKSENFRVAIVDYRDFPSRTGASQDYPSKLQLDFTSDADAIIAAINALNLGHGGDTPETVYSGLMEAIALDWRANAQKAIIVLGDAPPLDPEPYTGYTFNSVLAALYEADIRIDIDASDSRVFGETESLIKVYPIGTNADSAARAFFQSIANDTGGLFSDISAASEVSGAIIDSIEHIELLPRNNVTVSFGENFSGEIVEIFQNGQFYFEVSLDDNGNVFLASMDLDRYGFEIPRLMASGTFRVGDGNRQARIVFDESPWYSFAVMLWQRERPAVIAGSIGTAVLLAGIIIIRVKVKKRLSKHKTEAEEEPVQEILIDESPENIENEYTAAIIEESSQTNETLEIIEINETDAPISDKLKEEPLVPVEIICSNCGAQYGKIIKFCGKCGGKME